MKIEKIVYKSHSFFKENFEINFKKGDNIPLITYLVGNNGSGKTNILNDIYSVVSLSYQGNIKPRSFEADYYFGLNNEEVMGLNLDEHVLKQNISFNGIGGITTHGFFDLNGRQIGIVSDRVNDFKKITYSTAEVNFLNNQIKSVTASNVDQLNIDLSTNLDKTIPQLLVDIRTVDGEERMEWLRNNPNKTYRDCPDNIGGRMDRFVKGFNFVYGGTKEFSGIRNEGGEKVILFKTADGKEIDISKFSSGEQQILYRVGHILKNINLISGGIILVDEPELSLHPIRQERFSDMLKETFKNLDVQIIIATHSPYIFRKFDNNYEQVIKIDANKGINETLDMDMFLNSNRLSASYINYIAYDIVDYQLHIELYDALLRKFLGLDSDSPSKLDRFLIEEKEEPICVEFCKTGESNSTKETIMTWIRNKMHHQSEGNRPNFTEEHLKKSIERMLFLLKN